MTEVTFCGSLPTEESSNKVNFINKFGILNSIRIKIKCHIFFMIRNLTRLTFPLPIPTLQHVRRSHDLHQGYCN